MKSHPQIETTEEETLVAAAAKFIIKDARAFRTIDTEEFQKYTNSVANVA